MIFTFACVIVSPDMDIAMNPRLMSHQDEPTFPESAGRKRLQHLNEHEIRRFDDVFDINHRPFMRRRIVRDRRLGMGLMS